MSCLYCGSNQQPQTDHLVPRKRGGLNIKENLFRVCKPCNMSKGTRLPSEWRSDLSASVYELERIAISLHSEIKPRLNPNPKTAIINIRCTRAQKAIIEESAQREGMRASTWVLRLGLVAIETKAKGAR